MLIIVAVMAFGASRIQVAESYRLRRDRKKSCSSVEWPMFRPCARFSRKISGIPGSLTNSQPPARCPALCPPALQRPDDGRGFPTNPFAQREYHRCRKLQQGHAVP